MNSGRTAAWILTAAAIIAGTGRAAAAAASEYQIKAVFLFNFAGFVEWPPSAASADPKAPFVIGILGDDPFGNFIDEAVKGERAHNRPLVVRRYSRVEDASDAQILFISRSEVPRMEREISALKGMSVLTVGDCQEFGESGGIIRFMNEDNRIRLRINLDAARSAGLLISSKLLRPAEVVHGRSE